MNRRPASGSSWGVALGALAVLVVVVAAGLAGGAHLPGPRFSHRRGTQSGGAGQAPPSGTSQSPGHSLTTSTRLPHLDAFWPLLGVLVLALGILGLLVWQRWRNRRGRAAVALDRPGTGRAMAIDPVTPEEEPDAAPLLDDLATVLAEWESGEATDAVVRAWLGLEAAAERSGVSRRRAETPTEFTARVIGRALGDERAVRSLLGLYLRVRFGEHPPTSAELEAVRSALDRLVASWRAARPQVAGSGLRR